MLSESTAHLQYTVMAFRLFISWTIRDDSLLRHTVLCTDPSNIIAVELKIGYISLVEGVHERPLDVGVVQSKAVTKLMSSNLKKVGICRGRNQYNIHHE